MVISRLPTNMVRLMLGMKFLEGVVSRDEGFIKGLSMKRASMVVKLMHLLPQL